MAVVVRHKDAVADSGGAKGDAMYVGQLQLGRKVVCCQSCERAPQAVPCKGLMSLQFDTRLHQRQQGCRCCQEAQANVPSDWRV